MGDINKKPNILSRWLANARVGSIMQSLTPAVLAAIMALGTPGYSWWLAIIAIIGVECAHLVMNLSDDWFDYRSDMRQDKINVARRGIKAYTAKYPYLVDGSATVKDLKKAIAAFSAVSIACGLVVFVFRGWTVLAVAAAAGFLGVFYTAPPFKFAYYGLGEIVTGIIFGPLLMLGMSIACCGQVLPSVMMLSLPVGLLVANILFTHSYLDNAGDEESDKITLAGLMCRAFPKHPHQANLTVSAILNFSPFVIIVAAVCTGLVHWAYLALLLMLPRAIWLFCSLVKFSRGESIDSDIEHPAKYLGSLGNWEAMRQTGLGWFLIRWLVARNLVSGLSLMAAAIKLILLLVQALS